MANDTRTALIGIIVDNEDSVEALNNLLHEYRKVIIGRMGVPHPQKPISIISIAIEADQNTISALSGKLGALEGVSTKTIYSKM
jgi:putative iron-only hydrogenase system regulator